MPLTDTLAFLALSLLLKTQFHEYDIQPEERTKEIYRLLVPFSQLQPFNTLLLKYRSVIPCYKTFRKFESVRNCRV